MHKTLLKLAVLTSILLLQALSVFGQGFISVDASAVFRPTPVPGHHIDEFSVYSSLPIKTMEAAVRINPMRQINSGDSLTVFPTLLAPSDLNRDSHFLFDISTATILFEFEDTTEIRAKVEFNSNFPTTFKLAQIVAAENHSYYSAFVTGSFVDGRRFSTSIAFVPEPRIWILGICATLSCWIFKRASTSRPC